VLTRWQDRTLRDLLSSVGLDDAAEEPFPNDGWSGSTFSRLRRADGAAFVLKRTSARIDWIVRATRDEHLREAWAAVNLEAALGQGPVATPYVGAARDGDGAAILMRDLSGSLLGWQRPGAPPLTVDGLDPVLDAVAHLHAARWAADAPWCPLAERLLLTSRPTCLRLLPDGGAGAFAAQRLLAGWDAFDRMAPPAARALIADLSADVRPLVDALGRLPSCGLHGDLKLANVALLGRDTVGFIDWQMVTVAPVAVELGWLAVSNSADLPIGFDGLMARYRSALAQDAGGGAIAGDWDVQLDLARIVGLLLRGWRKGLDAWSGVRLGSGASGLDDLAEWSAAALEAAARRL
jgi:hypothetical protein